MKIIQTKLALIAVLVIGLFSCSPTADENNSTKPAETIQPLNEVNKLPVFNMIDAGGKTVDLSSFKGKKVFVNLWATWCLPCRAEIPSIEALVSKVDKDHAVFIMLSLDENFEVAKSFATKENMQVAVYYPAEKLPAIFNTDGIPATFIFNENGDLVKQNNGAYDYNTEEYLQIFSRK